MGDINVPIIQLKNGLRMPRIGFGTAHLSDDRAAHAVDQALHIGYRKVDTASAYGNECGVGQAIAASGLPRGELFVTTKVLRWHLQIGNVVIPL